MKQYSNLIKNIVQSEIAKKSNNNIKILQLYGFYIEETRCDVISNFMNTQKL